jgi:hypothetical protein
VAAPAAQCCCAAALLSAPDMRRPTRFRLDGRGVPAKTGDGYCHETHSVLNFTGRYSSGQSNVGFLLRPGAG